MFDQVGSQAGRRAAVYSIGVAKKRKTGYDGNEGSSHRSKNRQNFIFYKVNNHLAIIQIGLPNPEIFATFERWKREVVKSTT